MIRDQGLPMKIGVILAGTIAAGLLGPVRSEATDLLRPTVAPVASSWQSGWFVHAGPAGLVLNESAKISLGGARVPGASISIDPQLTAAVEFGYFFNPNFAVSFTGGFPPTVDVLGRGTVAGLGKLGTATYGPATLTAHYHFTGFGNIQPYIGAGPTFMYVFNTKDGALSDLKLANAVGFAVQAGVNVMIDRNWGVFFDVKKAYLRSTTTGTLGGIPAKGKVVLDPLVIHTGVTYKF